MILASNGRRIQPIRSTRIPFHCSQNHIHTPKTTLPVSSTILLPLPTEEPQSPFLRFEQDLRSLGKEEHVPLDRLHRLARLVRDLEVTVDDDLTFIVRVRVFERSAGIEAVEASGDGRLWGEAFSTSKILSISPFSYWSDLGKIVARSRGCKC